MREFAKGRLPAAVATFAAFALAMLALSAAAGPRAQAAPAGLGGQLYATGGPITITVLPHSAQATSELWLFGASATNLGATNRDTGRVVTLPPLPAGTELVFGIVVRDGGGAFKLGPNDRNPDGVVHATTAPAAGGGVVVGFEDLRGGGDQDYNDLVFLFEGGVLGALPGNQTDDGSAQISTPIGGESGGSGGSGGSVGGGGSSTGGSTGSGGGTGTGGAGGTASGGGGGGGGGGGSAANTSTCVPPRIERVDASAVGSREGIPERADVLAAYTVCGETPEGTVITYRCASGGTPCRVLRVYFRGSETAPFSTVPTGAGTGGELTFFARGAGVYVVAAEAACAPLGAIVQGTVPATGGLGLFVFCDGTSAELLAATGCPAATAAYWTTANGAFVIYLPGTSVAAVNEAWAAQFPDGLIAGLRPLIGKCR